MLKLLPTVAVTAQLLTYPSAMQRMFGVATSLRKVTRQALTAIAATYALPSPTHPPQLIIRFTMSSFGLLLLMLVLLRRPLRWLLTRGRSDVAKGSVGDPVLPQHHTSEPFDRQKASHSQSSSSGHRKDAGRSPVGLSRMRKFGRAVRSLIPAAIWLSAALVVAGAALQSKQPPDQLVPVLDRDFAIGFQGNDQSQRTGDLTATFSVSPDNPPSFSNHGRCGRWATVEVMFVGDSRYLAHLGRGPGAAPRALPRSVVRMQNELSSLAASGRTHVLSARKKSRIDSLKDALDRKRPPEYERRTAPVFAIHVDGADLIHPSLESPSTTPSEFDFFNEIVRLRIEGGRRNDSKELKLKSLDLQAKSELELISGSGSVTAKGRDLLGHLSIYAGLDVRAVAWSALFSAPVVARHGVGSCWVRLPKIATGRDNDVAVARSRVSAPFTVFANSHVGLVNASDSQPSPNGANLTWTCNRSAPQSCGAWALVDASWRGTYHDFSLLLAGVMLSVAAELALRARERRR
jgi:hypothetical protein